MTTVFYKKPLFWIIVFAFVLRIAGIFEGLPAIYNSTEHHLIKFALKMAANKTLDPGFYIYPSLYQYLLVIIYGIYFIVGFFLGIFKDSYDFAVQFLINPFAIFVIGRLVNVIISTSSVFYLYKLVKKISNYHTALLASVLLSLSYYSIHLGQLATQDTLLIFFSILAINKFWDSLENQNLIHLFYSGVFTGLAVAAKYNAGFLGFGLFLTVFFSWKIHQNYFVKRAFLSFSGLFISFFIANPYWVITPEKYWQAYIMITEQMHYGTSIYRGINYLWEIQETIMHEWLLGVLFFISIIYAIQKNQKFFYILLSIIIPTFFYVGSWPKKGIDYLLVCWPIFAIFSALLFQNILEQLNNKKFKVLLIIFLFLPSIIYNMHQLALKFTPDTRQLASEWLLQNVSNDDKICYDKNGYDLTLIDVHRFTDYGPSAKILPLEMKNRLLQYLDMDRNVNFISSIEWVKDIISDSISQDYFEQQGAVRWKELRELVTEGVDWLIINEDYKQSYIRFSNAKIPKLIERIENMKRFYNEVDSIYNPVMKFSKTFWITGPEIKIYNLNSINTN